MVDKSYEGEIDPVICAYCQNPIEEKEQFIEVKTNMGVKFPSESRGYVKGILQDPYLEFETQYVHLRHVLFAPLD